MASDPPARTAAAVIRGAHTARPTLSALAVAIMLGVHLLRKYTDFGRAQRAVTENLDLAGRFVPGAGVPAGR